MTSAPRILHIIASLSSVHGGTTSSVIRMIQVLESSGVHCEVAASDDDGPGRRLASNAAERDVLGRHYFAKRHDTYVYTPSIRPWLDANVSAYDVVHIHGLFSHVNGLAGRICRRRGVPYVVTPHGMVNRYSIRHKRVRKAISFVLVERQLLAEAAVIHMTSRSEEREFSALAVKTPVRRIPLAVSQVPLGDGAAFLARHPEIGNRKVAVFMGRLNPIKNLEAMIDALALAGGSDLHLIICGDGPEHYVRALKARATKQGVAARISWLGFVSGEDKADVLAAGDIYVQPSLSESFGMAAVEAVSAGLPCVLGENVAIAEDLVAARLAVAVAPTAEAIVDGIMAANLDAGDKSDFAARARAFVSSSFGSAPVAADLLAMYSEASASISKGGA